MLPRIPETVCGVETAVLVVDDGSRDRTGDVAREHGAAVARHVTNLGGGAALRTGYRLMSDSGAQVVVTLDADGQHLPEEMSRLVQPVLDGEVDMAHGSRVLGHAEANHFAREMGIVFFNRLVSFITRTKVTDCSNGYRAVRASVLPTLVLRQEQFHTSEFMIEAIKRGVPATEVPVTVVSRLHGHSKKPAVHPLRDRVHERDHADLAALSRLTSRREVRRAAHPQAPRVQAQHPRAGRARAVGEDRRRVEAGGRVERAARGPARSSSSGSVHPARLALGDGDVVRRIPVGAGHVGRAGEVGALERRGPGGGPADQAVGRALPDGVHDARARAPAAVDGGDAAPHDAMGDGDELAGEIEVIDNHGCASYAPSR